jgi:hypothetical protein
MNGQTLHQMDMYVHHLQSSKLQELQHLQALLMLRIHLWWCVNPLQILNNVFLHIIKQIKKWIGY